MFVKIILRKNGQMFYCILYRNSLVVVRDREVLVLLYLYYTIHESFDLNRFPYIECK